MANIISGTNETIGAAKAEARMLENALAALTGDRPAAAIA